MPEIEDANLRYVLFNQKALNYTVKAKGCFQNAAKRLNIDV